MSAVNDFRFAFRALARNQASTILIVALLGLGIGASTTIYSLFDAVLIRSLPVRHPEQLVRVVQRLPKFPPKSNFPYLYYEALRDHAATFRAVFGETGEGIHLRLTQPAPAEEITVHAVTPEFFKALGVRPYLGRVLMADDAVQKSGITPVLLSYSFWHRHFNGNREVVNGKTVTINGHRFAIAGVMGREFNGLSADTSPDIRIPLEAYPLLTDFSRERTFFELAGRLKPGVKESVAEAECLAIWQSVMKDFYLKVDREPPEVTASLLKRGINLESLARGTSDFRDRLGDVLKLLLAATSVLVLIIGLNVSGILLARAVARHGEMAIRLAIGASPMQLARLMAVESVLLSGTSAAVALLVTVLLTPFALHMVPTVRSVYTTIVPLSIDLGMNWRVFLFLLLITTSTALAFTVSPIIAISQISIDSILRTARSTAHAKGRQWLIAMQIALCTFLLVCAGQLARSFQQLAQTASGFSADSVATFTRDLAGYKGASSFPQLMMERVRQIPRVASVATSSIGIMRGHGRSANIALAGQRVGHDDFMSANVNDVSPAYFRTMGMRILSGRDFTGSDTPKPKHAAATKVVVNEAFVRRYYGAANAIGQQFGSAVEGSVARPDYEIIGVVSDAKYRSLREPMRPMFYALETDFDSFVLNVRTNVRPEAILEPVRKAAASIAPDLPFLEVNTLAQEVEETTAPEQMTAALASFFGVVAALLAGVGIYGLLTYMVRQKRREIGIRMALGAQPANIARLIARQTLVITLGGITAGVAAAILIGPAIRSLLYGLSPNDPKAFAAAGIFVGIIAAGATIAPVLNAIRTQPAETLRLEN